MLSLSNFRDEVLSRVTCHAAANAHLSRVQDVREGAPELRRGRGAVSAPGNVANRLIGEVVQSRRRPLLGPSPG